MSFIQILAISSIVVVAMLVIDYIEFKVKQARMKKAFKRMSKTLGSMIETTKGTQGLVQSLIESNKEMQRLSEKQVAGYERMMEILNKDAQ